MSFLDDLARLGAEPGPAPWTFADDPRLVGLERWARAFAERDLRAAVRALCRAGLDALPARARRDQGPRRGPILDAIGRSVTRS